MAGDWIKMRSDLFTHPKVVRMASALQADTIRIVGGLMFVWTLFDAHSVDGEIDGYTLEAIDGLVRWPGFADAMTKVHWLVEMGESLVLPEFETHNGASAKRRAQDSDRKKLVRNLSASQADVCPQSVRKTSALEKRREEDSTKSSKSKALSPPAGVEVTTPSVNGHDLAGEIILKPDRKDVPFAKIIELYHAMLPMLPKVEKLTDKRRGYIRQRWAEDLPTLDAWKNYFADVAKSRFLTGQAQGINGRPPFMANLEWLCNPSNFTKVAEGNYHR